MTEQEQTVDLIKEFLIRIFDYTEFQISPWETLESNKFSQRYRLALRVYVENESPLIFIITIRSNNTEVRIYTPTLGVRYPTLGVRYFNLADPNFSKEVLQHIQNSWELFNRDYRKP